MKRLFAVILILAMALSLCACGETEPSMGDQMYEKYGALIDKLEAGDFEGAADSVFAMMPEGEKYSSVVGKLKAEDYEGIIAEITEMMPVPPETVVEITPENFWDYYEIAYEKPYTEKDAQGNITRMYPSNYCYFALKAPYSNIDFDRSSVEIGVIGDCKVRKIKNIDWTNGSYTLGNEYYEDIAQAIIAQYIDDTKLSISTTATGALNIWFENGTPYGCWHKDAWGWTSDQITPEDDFDMYVCDIDNVEIVRAEGTLVLLNG